MLYPLLPLIDDDRSCLDIYLLMPFLFPPSPRPGPYHTGKSFIMNHLAAFNDSSQTTPDEIFGVGRGVRLSHIMSCHGVNLLTRRYHHTSLPPSIVVHKLVIGLTCPSHLPVE